MDDLRASKTLSLLLRHDPARFGVSLDPSGWIEVSVLLAALADHGVPVTHEQLTRVVQTSDKQRFAFDESGSRIRANQGHSVPVDLGLTPTKPPDTLFHGTPTRNLDSISQQGLMPGQRHAVHLSRDIDTARTVGARRGAHVVVVVDAAAMHADGHEFTVSANGVWLVASVPARYLTVPGR